MSSLAEAPWGYTAACRCATYGQLYQHKGVSKWARRRRRCHAAGQNSIQLLRRAPQCCRNPHCGPRWNDTDDKLQRPNILLRQPRRRHNPPRWHRWDNPTKGHSDLVKAAPHDLSAHERIWPTGHDRLAMRTTCSLGQGVPHTETPHLIQPLDTGDTRGRRDVVAHCRPRPPKGWSWRVDLSTRTTVPARGLLARTTAPACG